MMDLREKLGLNLTATPKRQARFERFGVLENPFPAASQPMEQPHREVPADSHIQSRLKAFLDSGATEVVVVEGTQGLGKTNLLEYYQRALEALFGSSDGYYIVRYLADPEPDFGRVVRQLFQAIGTEGLARIGKMASDDTVVQERALNKVRGYETRVAFKRLSQAAATGKPDTLDHVAGLMLEYLTGLRVLKVHREWLGIQFRLDTTEAMTQALHDLVYFSSELGSLKYIFLFLDELEKQGGLPQRHTTGYLSAIRALIDSLPHHLFLVLAMTPESRARYARMLPALAGRLNEVIQLSAISNEEEAVALHDFYVSERRSEAKKQLETAGWEAGDSPILSTEVVVKAFGALGQRAERQGVEGGPTPRAFLDRLHDLAAPIIESL